VAAVAVCYAHYEIPPAEAGSMSLTGTCEFTEQPRQAPDADSLRELARRRRRYAVIARFGRRVARWP
jgi:hypothetical protein